MRIRIVDATTQGQTGFLPLARSYAREVSLKASAWNSKPETRGKSGVKGREGTGMRQLNRRPSPRDSNRQDVWGYCCSCILGKMLLSSGSLSSSFHSFAITVLAI